VVPEVATRPGLGQCEAADTVPPRRENQACEAAPQAGGNEYLTTGEAARYLRMSVSRLLRIPDVRYVRGRPNIYARRDLDEWYDRHASGVR
jgi:hypothetical protein